MSRWKKGFVALLCVRLLVSWGWSQPADPVLNYLRDGIEAYQRGEWQACADALEKAIALGFSNPFYKLDALVILGRTYSRMGDLDRSQRCFRRVLDIQTDYRLDPSDTTGLKTFNQLLDGGGGLPIGKIAVGIALVGVVAARVLGPVDSCTPRPKGTVEGEIELP